MSFVVLKYFSLLRVHPETSIIENEGLVLPQGYIKVHVIRSMFGGKMSGILTGSGGANCQLCTVAFDQLLNIEFIRPGSPINRNISATKQIFAIVDKDEYLVLPSQ